MLVTQGEEWGACLAVLLSFAANIKHHQASHGKTDKIHRKENVRGSDTAMDGSHCGTQLKVGILQLPL